MIVLLGRTTISLPKPLLCRVLKALLFGMLPVVYC